MFRDCDWAVIASNEIVIVDEKAMIVQCIRSLGQSDLLGEGRETILSLLCIRDQTNKKCLKPHLSGPSGNWQRWVFFIYQSVWKKNQFFVGNNLNPCDKWNTKITFRCSWICEFLYSWFYYNIQDQNWNPHKLLRPQMTNSESIFSILFKGIINKIDN